MELELSSTVFEPAPDTRPRMWPPPPVHLVAVADVDLPALAGTESQLDEFYENLLQFERDTECESLGEQIVYRAENCRLRLNVRERPPLRDDFRPLIIPVPSLTTLVHRLDELEVKYVRQNGLTPGTECIVLKDPTGNFVQVTEIIQLI